MFTIVFRDIMKGKRHRKPDALVIGVKKYGTSALKNFLKMHTFIAMTGDELHFFGNDDDYRKGLEYYINHMLPVSLPDQLTIEISRILGNKESQ